MPSVQGVEFWYAIQTYYAQEAKVGHFLKAHNLCFFIPMLYSYVSDANGNPVKKPVPAVHNIIFLKKTMSKEELKCILAECPFAVRVYTYPSDCKWVEICDSDILELRFICDSAFADIRFVSAQETEMKVGHMVKVVHGPLKGIHGRLIRKNKKYYVVKNFAGLGVIACVSRWCCERMEESEEGKVKSEK